MSKRELQKDIRGGVILSEGTLNLFHLLAKAYDLMESYKLRTPLKRQILEFYGLKEKPGWLWEKVYWGRVEENPEKNEEGHYLWEAVYDYFNDIAPRKYYFGSHMGDGACIGWFEVEEI